METCEWCGASFDPDEAEAYFTSEFRWLSYSNVKKCLCGNCAVEAIQSMADGVYFETCEKCGRTFDLIEDESTFENYVTSDSDTHLCEYWKKQILCADCAIELVNSECDDDEHDDEDNGERLSVHEAARIWASHGKDEDYMFGYTEAELEDTL